jgi:uncharacterized DUF497 family protein
MRIELDPDKDARNQAKHGVSLSLAGELDWKLRLSGLMSDSSTAS